MIFGVSRLGAISLAMSSGGGSFAQKVTTAKVPAMSIAPAPAPQSAPAPSPVAVAPSPVKASIAVGSCPPEPERDPNHPILFKDPDAGVAYLACLAAKQAPPVVSSSPPSTGAGQVTYQVPAGSPAVGAPQPAKDGAGVTSYQVPAQDLDVRGSLEDGGAGLVRDTAPSGLSAPAIPPVVVAAGVVAALGVGLLLVRRFL